ncbi:MAG: Fic family protein [Bacteroidales bacterium]|nr:Fic family protein [Bacteroidales bacterium]MEA4840782.1 Fic family protein [Bacteroidales bacterium]
MKPPYKITSFILSKVSSISEKLGEVNANYLSKPSPQLRKQNRIRTIHASLSIEGNTLTQEQVTALLDNKRVLGPKKDIQEVLNAIKVYDQLSSFDPYSRESFLLAHQILMGGLIETPGRFRNQSVGIVHGKEIAHVAPPAVNVPFLMKDLFGYLKDDEDLILIKSCVFHYEMEFIHPFLDGNGRMGRLWQTIILSKANPVFEFLPLETLIIQTQADYYKALAISDKAGESTAFIEYMLKLIEDSLIELLDYNNKVLNDTDRIEYFISLNKGEFTRKDYMNVFKDISSATASRDIKKGVDMMIFEKTGDKRLTKYLIK